MIDNLFDKNYIENCINNSDLQAMWGFELYSSYWDMTRKEICTLIEDTMNERPEHIYWVPRQDEIQLILKQKIERFNNMTDLKFDFNMRQCVFQTYCHKILSTLSLNQMWLIFFMRQLFGKQWVPESKSWELRNI